MSGSRQLATKGTLELQISDHLSELEGVSETMENFAEEHQLGFAVVTKVNIILDEVLSNIIKYGETADKSLSKSIGLVVESGENGSLQITVSDNCAPFNPLERDDPDTSTDLESREIGGLGIYLVKKLANSVTYEWRANKNILKIELGTDS